MNPENSNLMATAFEETGLNLEKPQWLEGNVINEVIFADEYLRANPMKRIRGKLFTVDGPVEDEESIRSDIYNVICNHVSTGTPRRASSLLEAIKLACYSEPLPLQEDRIHVANGTYFLDGRFTTEKSFCTNRLAVEYDPDAPRPEQWLNFLSELLHEEDISSLQEYIGYLMIPSTRAQRMMMLIGQGGEGKSRIGCVLRAMFGDSMSVGSLHKVETNKFARADLEFKLLLVDDDLPMEALPQTNNLKTLVTNEGKTDIERKGEQSVQRVIYARFLCFGNGVLKAKNDSSYAFYRRQLLIDVKERDPERVDDVFLADRLKEELPGIFLWALEGLQRLISNGFHFTESERSRKNLEKALISADTIKAFMRSDEVVYDRTGQVTTYDLYDAYENWCFDCEVPAKPYKTFAEEMYNRAEQFRIKHSKHINRTQHGFRGVHLKNQL